MSDRKRIKNKFRPDIDEIISRIGGADEIKITEFDFDKCFTALRKINENI